MIPYDGWCLARQLAGHTLNGEADRVSGPLRPLVDLLNNTAVNQRRSVLDGHLCCNPDREGIIELIVGLDPAGPPPEARARKRAANLGDVRQQIRSTEWIWPGYLIRGHLTSLSSDPKVGKTRFIFDLARRLWFGLPFPDGQANPFPTGSTSLWVCGDKQQAQLIELADAAGMPDEAILFPTDPGSPFAGTRLDEENRMQQLGEYVAECRPAFFVVDTAWSSAPSFKLYRAEDVATYMGPLVAITQENRCGGIISNHLSKDQETLGRRMDGICRVILKLTRPDEENKARLRLDVESNSSPGPPLGITMGDVGNEADDAPPPKADRSSRGPAAEKQKACEEWLKAQLVDGPRKVVELRKQAEAAGFSVGTLYNAKAALDVDEDASCKPKLWRLPTPGFGDEEVPPI